MTDKADTPKQDRMDAAASVWMRLRLVLRCFFLLCVIAILTFVAVNKHLFFGQQPILKPQKADGFSLAPLKEQKSVEVAVLPVRAHESDFEEIRRQLDAKPVDWKNTRITGPVKGAYIVVYLSRRIMGLVLKGKYIRVYYNIGIPANISGGKKAKNDGMCPVGDYYVCSYDIDRSNNVMKLRISYPSEADARKALAAGKINRSTYNSIASAIKDGKAPPVNTALGGPVYIRGDYKSGMKVKDGVAITSEQMAELWLASRKGMPVMIRK